MQNVLPRSAARAYTVSDDASADQRYKKDNIINKHLSGSVKVASVNTDEEMLKWCDHAYVSAVPQSCGKSRILLISRIPAFLRERPEFVALFRNNKNR